MDRYLAGWKATLLSSAGRDVLVNSVLDGVTIYAMGAMMLLLGVRDAINARRRAFLWTGRSSFGHQVLGSVGERMQTEGRQRPCHGAWRLGSQG